MIFDAIEFVDFELSSKYLTLDDFRKSSSLEIVVFDRTTFRRDALTTSFGLPVVVFEHLFATWHSHEMNHGDLVWHSSGIVQRRCSFQIFVFENNDGDDVRGRWIELDDDGFLPTTIKHAWKGLHVSDLPGDALVGFGGGPCVHARVIAEAAIFVQVPASAVENFPLIEEEE
jgi:hypothetical protein